jgi:hypothetical protein
MFWRGMAHSLPHRHLAGGSDLARPTGDGVKAHLPCHFPGALPMAGGDRLATSERLIRDMALLNL